MSKSTRAIVFYWLAVIASSLGMYAAYLFLQSNSNQLSLAIGLLGAAAGFFASQASNVKNQTALERILGASLIREKEIEAKTVEEAKALYEKELANLKEIIEREGNLLLLKRLRSVYIDDLREKLREVESLSSELAGLEHTQPTPEVAEVRKRLEGLLVNVRNPEEDDRLIRQFCYSLPVFGNVIYFVYSVWKKVDPTVQDRVHQKLNSLARGSKGNSPLLRAVALAGMAFLAIGIVAVIAAIVWHL